LGSMRTDLCVEEAGALVDPRKCREGEAGHWCEEKGRFKTTTPTPHLHAMVSNV